MRSASGCPNAWYRAAYLLFLICVSAQGVAEQTLRVGTYALPRALGNPHSSTSVSEIYTWAAIFDNLTSVDANGRVLPALAVAWESLDEFTWRFHLRQGVRFSNGESFDAAAVVATIDYITSKAAARESVAREFSSLRGAQALDRHTVEITTHTPTLVLPAKLAALRMVAPDQWQRLGPDGFSRQPAGTGPFMVESWGSARATLVAFRDSWRAPKVDRLEIYEILDPSARLQGVQSGRLDIGLIMGPDDIEALESTGNRAYIGPGAGVVGMTLITVKDSPLRDVRVRQALNYAVDKQAIVDVLLKGHTQPVGQPAIRKAHGYNPDIKPYPYDPDRARALLAEAGYADGFDMVTEVVLGGSTGGGALYSFIAQQLAAVGVRMEVRSVPIAQLIIKTLTGDFAGQAFGMEYDFKPTMDIMRAIPIHSCLRLVPWHCDPAVMPLIEQAQREFDPARRLQLMHELTRIYHDAAPMLYLYESVHFDGLSRRVRHYDAPNRIINYHEIELVD